MAHIKCPIDYIPLQQVTAANLNAHVNNAQLQPGAISDHTALPDPLASGDQFLVNDVSATPDELRSITAGAIFSSGLPITTGAITGNAGANIVITPASTYALSVAGNLSSTGNLSVTGTSTLTGDVTASGLLTVVGNASFNSVEALKLPSGTTLQRPASPVAGQMRYNTSTVKIESYNGTTWSELDNRYDEYDVRVIVVPAFTSWANQTIWESPLITIPADETWVYEVSLILSGDNNNGNTRPEMVGAVKLQIGTTNLSFHRVDHGTYGGPMSPVLAVTTLTSTNTPTAQRVKLSSDATQGGSFRSGWNSASHLKVSLTRRKTANVGNPTTYI